ncbi:mevalonate kinase [Nocardia mexicana]|uniref:mevalonate kinase n=1 Tax=Nocardia mexicana TaxID=279262 RepID=A0A370H1U2_9NOCA|nr:mevalonate kinase [Nocardia mexicana]RDI49985.1 mevalonate kinase [Nocardia mexicana]
MTREQERRLGSGRAHAKVIVFGEHAVVYGAPAIAAPVPELAVHVSATRSPSESGCRVTFSEVEPGAGTSALREPADAGLQTLVSNTLRAFGIGDCGIDLVVDCPIPPARGLGSSAACGRAVAVALADLFDRELDAQTGFDLVQSAERVAHGTPSGVDTAATASTVPILFRDGVAAPLSIGPETVFVVADSGTSSSTKDSVSRLRRRFEREPAEQRRFVTAITDITRSALTDIECGDVRGLGTKMTENHWLLGDLGLSTAHLDHLVQVALQAGACGAKVTGGGSGGCLLAVAEGPERAAEVAVRLGRGGAVATWTMSHASRSMEYRGSRI